MMALLLLAAIQPVAAQPPPPKVIDCLSGPASVEFGRLVWRIYACDDGSLTVLAAKSNPTFPSMLSLRPVNGHAVLSGNLTRNSDAAAGALAEMRALNAVSLGRLHALAHAAHGTTPPKQ